MLEELQGPWLQAGETLVFFGDSLTEASAGYVSMLTETLTKHGIKVINAGLGGDKTPAALTRLDSAVGIHKPDAVSIFFGANDAAIGRGIWADEPTVDPVCYRDNLCWMVHLLKLRYQVKKFSIATPLWRFEGIPYNMHGDILTAYRLMARDAAEKTRSVLIPLDTAWEKQTMLMESRRNQTTGLLLTTDGTHPTREGYQLIADTFLKYWKMTE